MSTRPAKKTRLSSPFFVTRYKSESIVVIIMHSFCTPRTTIKLLSYNSGTCSSLGGDIFPLTQTDGTIEHDSEKCTCANYESRLI
jgi:hypothetical protein